MSEKSPVIINNIFYIKVNAIENASALNIGENYLVDWNNASKYTQGFGDNYGDSSNFLDLKAMIDDRDLIDSPSTFTKNKKE